VPGPSFRSRGSGQEESPTGHLFPLHHLVDHSACLSRLLLPDEPGRLVQRLSAVGQAEALYVGVRGHALSLARRGHLFDFHTEEGQKSLVSLSLFWDKFKGGGVDAVPLSGRGRAVVEHVAQVGSPSCVDYFYSGHEGDAPVGHLDDVIWVYRGEEARPSCSGIELRFGGEDRKSSDGALVDSGLLGIVGVAVDCLACKGSLGSLADCHVPGSMDRKDTSIGGLYLWKSVSRAMAAALSSSVKGVMS